MCWVIHHRSLSSEHLETGLFCTRTDCMGKILINVPSPSPEKGVSLTAPAQKQPRWPLAILSLTKNDNVCFNVLFFMWRL